MCNRNNTYEATVIYCFIRISNFWLEVNYSEHEHEENVVKYSFSINNSCKSEGQLMLIITVCTLL